MSLQLTQGQTDAIKAHAARDYPHECCGFLVGRNLSPPPPSLQVGGAETKEEAVTDTFLLPPSLQVGGPGGIGVHHITPAANLRDDSPRNRFEIDPGDFVKTEKAARAEGMGIVGFYHSHPDAPAKPSEFDREHAWPGYCYVIVSVEAGKPQEMLNWRLRDDRSGFDADPIVTTD